MKVLTKLLADFVAWRWAPTVGLLSASVLFVLIVVGLVPSEIGVPVANSKFSGKPRATGTTAQPEGPSRTALAGTNDDEDGPTTRAMPSPVAAAVSPNRPAEFGRRGFSPVLDRPEAPPEAPPPLPLPPAQPAMPVQAQAVAQPTHSPGAMSSRMGAIFQNVQNSFRPQLGPNGVPQPPPGGPGGPGGPPGQPPGAAPPGAAEQPGTAPVPPGAVPPEAPPPAPGTPGTSPTASGPPPVVQ